MSKNSQMGRTLLLFILRNGFSFAKHFPPICDTFETLKIAPVAKSSVWKYLK